MGVGPTGSRRNCNRSKFAVLNNEQAGKYNNQVVGLKWTQRPMQLLIQKRQ